MIPKATPKMNVPLLSPRKLKLSHELAKIMGSSIHHSIFKEPFFFPGKIGELFHRLGHTWPKDRKSMRALRSTAMRPRRYVVFH